MFLLPVHDCQLGIVRYCGSSAPVPTALGFSAARVSDAAINNDTAKTTRPNFDGFVFMMTPAYGNAVI